MNQHIYLWGLSGSGKTTVGKALAAKLSLPFIDLDDYYHCKINPEKPMPKLPSGKTNWDCLEALDLDKFYSDCAKNPAVIAGFVVPPNINAIVVELFVGEGEVAILRTIAARKMSKPFSPDKAKEDELTVRQVVYPSYMKQERIADFRIPIYELSGQRRSVAEITQQIVDLLSL